MTDMIDTKEISQFINKYSLSKTLRFSLIPQAETEGHIKKILEEDQEKAYKYKQAKKIIDEVHKEFINKALNSFIFEEGLLNEYKDAYDTFNKDKKNATYRTGLSAVQTKLRKSLVNHFKKEGVDELFDKPLFNKTIPKWLNDHPHHAIKGVEDPASIIEYFKNWTTYFGGFHENRKNIYTHEPQSTAIAYRLIHVNLLRFIQNIKRYEDTKKLGLKNDFVEVEKDLDVNLDDIFRLPYFNKCLTQVGIERYNLIRGGQSKNIKDKKQGINEKINLATQRIGDKDKAKSIRKCTLEELQKQILSDVNTSSFRFEEIENDSQLCTDIDHSFALEEGELMGKEMIVNTETDDNTEFSFNISTAIKKALENLEEADETKIYLRNNTSLTQISNAIFDRWNIIELALRYYIETTKVVKDKKGNEKPLSKTAITQIKNWLEKPYFSFNEIHSALTIYFDRYSDEELQKEDKNKEGITLEMKKQAKDKPLFKYFKNLTINIQNEKKNLFDEIKAHYNNIKSVISKYSDIEQQKLKSDKESVEKIKNYLDSIMNLFHFIKPMDLKFSKQEEKQGLQNEYEEATNFYPDFKKIIHMLEHIVPLYNRARNYLTKKSFSIEKYKLNFENSTLAAGWAKNKESANSCVLLVKEGLYYLGVMNKKHNKLFTTIPDNNQKTGYKKMEYKQIANVTKDIQNLMVIGVKTVRKTGGKEKDGADKGKNLKLEKLKNEHLPSDINEIRKKGSYLSTSVKFDKEDCIKFIEYYKERIMAYTDFDFSIKPSKEYADFNDFLKDVDNQGYKITLVDVAEDYINECVKAGKLYLFQIYNKDFSKQSKGKKNLHTLYWEALFSKENLDNVVYKLNGEAELFFRKKSITYSDDIWKQGHHAEDLKEKFKYPIIKDRRYAKDTYLFHVPITLNFKADGVSKFNDSVIDFLKNNPEVNILGIDRGERHLLYVTLINQKGEMLEKPISLNKPDGKLGEPDGKQDYQKLLHKKETERADARKTWGTIERIKDLKEGYLSIVVHKIAKLMIENNAIIVLENLNFGFKKSRFKVEKQIYQKFEKMLIDKLNYLVFKDKKNNEDGGLMRAYQLTDKFTSFEKLGNQTGFIFYVPAYHTSKICPVTGFVNLLYPKYETIVKSQDFFKKFDSICYNSKEKYFEFKIDYKKFDGKIEGCKPNWTVCTHGTRLENYRNSEEKNQWETREVKLTEELEKLFQSRNIDFSKENDIKDLIIGQGDSIFFRALTNLLSKTLQMRNSSTDSDEDWIVSPVKDEKKGKFFDSRKVDDNFMPQDADANGAYHIALKGLLLKNKIDKGEEINDPITNAEWYEFIQKKEYKDF